MDKYEICKIILQISNYWFLKHLTKRIQEPIRIEILILSARANSVLQFLEHGQFCTGWRQLIAVPIKLDRALLSTRIQTSEVLSEGKAASRPGHIREILEKRRREEQLEDMNVVEKYLLNMMHSRILE